jgi:hypothetical protein
MDEDLEELTYLEKQKLPAELLFDAVENRAAVYSTNHRLLAPLASKKRLAFVKTHTAGERCGDESKYCAHNTWYPMPDWATPEVRERCVLIEIQREGIDDDAYWRSIPKK